MTQPRLCFVGWGDHVHLERWAGQFSGGDFQADVLSLTGPGRYADSVRQACLPFPGRGPVWLRGWLRWMLWRWRPDLVHVHWAHFSPEIWRIWRGPLVVTAWGSDIYRRENFDALQWEATGQALRAADLVTCDSEDLAQRLRTEFGLRQDLVQVIQWGVDTELFRPDGPDLRAELGLQGREIVLSARNFTPLYNQETVIKAFVRVRQARPNAFLLMKNFRGDPAYVDVVRGLIRQHGLHDDVRILETVPYAEMPALYRTADVTVSVPHSDAAPMALFEAMACGSAVVVGDLPSLREWVVDGQSGRVVPTTDAQFLADALVRLLADASVRQGMARFALETCVPRASQKQHMARMAAHYRRLIAFRYAR